ncbi:MAG: hypothetical protein AB1896_22500, partial [Thermodesulfobacteriota bacterium]
MQLIAINREDGGVSIMVCPEAIVGEEIKKWEISYGSKAVESRPIALDKLPGDRVFREAWSLDGDRVVVNMEKA